LIDHAIAALAPIARRWWCVGATIPAMSVWPIAPRLTWARWGRSTRPLRHAADHGFDGVLVTGCDMPVFPAALVDALVGDGGAVLAGQQLAGWWPASLADMLDDHLACAKPFDPWLDGAGEGA
jgi:molybdopterin-guanine dinucleotide biosynthesis protein A